MYLAERVTTNQRKQSNLIGKLNVEEGMFFKSITGLAKGCYAVVLKQFDANNIDYTGITNGAEAAAGEKFTITLTNTSNTRYYVTVKYTVNGVETTVLNRQSISGKGTYEFEFEMPEGDVTITITQSRW